MIPDFFRKLRSFFSIIAVIMTVLSAAPAFSASHHGGKRYGVPILLYHRFAAKSYNAMTMTVNEFKDQMALIKEKGFNVIPLEQLVNAYLGKGPFPSPGSIVIVVDDGHRSFYDKAYPVMKSQGLIATLFVYPLDIGYEPTMSWSQLEELAANGFNVQSHTFSHLNIRKVREGLDKDHYEKLVNAELEISKMVIERKLGSQVDCLAYPYGNYDNTVLKEAIEVGYDAGFTINPRANYPNDAPQELNRYTITPGLGQKAFLKILETSLPRHTHTPGLPSLVRNKMMPDKTHELQGKREIPHDSSDGS